MNRSTNTNPECVSTQTKIEQCSGLIGTSDLNDWETTFIRSQYDNLIRYGEGFRISEKQDFHLNKIWSKHFAG